jgi:hypothetical protein
VKISGDLLKILLNRLLLNRSARLWLVIHVWIIGVRDETGNIVRRVSIGATSVVGDRARVRRFRRIRNLRISGRPAQTATALAGACGQAASHPRIGGTGVPSPGLSEQACMATSAGSISAHAARQANTAASRAEKLVLGSAPLASHSSETGASTTSPIIDSHSRLRHSCLAREAHDAGPTCSGAALVGQAPDLDLAARR